MKLLNPETGIKVKIKMDNSQLVFTITNSVKIIFNGSLIKVIIKLRYELLIVFTSLVLRAIISPLFCLEKKERGNVIIF